MEKISCIISAYNEGPRIHNVLKIVTTHPNISEVIVINDGSTDNTAKVADTFEKTHLINHKTNKGKTASMLDGCLQSKNESILFLDADLKNLNHNNITAIIQPILSNSIDMCIGMIRHDTRFHQIAKIIGHGAYSGQRAMKKDIAINTLSKVNGYAAEAKINQYVLKNKLRLKVVDWLNVNAVLRMKEISIRESYNSYYKTFKEIFSVINPIVFFIQLLKMRKRSF